MSESFVVNVEDARWVTCEGFGAGTTFESREDRFGQVGINIRLLGRGDVASIYHSETAQEDFLVLEGTCTLIVEGEARQLRAWDFVHCPPGTAHVFVGVGDDRCILLMIGARGTDITYRYPVCDAAINLGAGVETETESPDEAYANAAPLVTERPPNWDDLPWSGRNRNRRPSGDRLSP